MTERETEIDIAHQQATSLRISYIYGDQRIDKDELSCSGDSSGVQTPERKERLKEQGNTTPSNVEAYTPSMQQTCVYACVFIWSCSWCRYESQTLH